ncbi:uncharacterized protein TEOVI_000582000 [Trypanosoma equiperdum]|uniref:Uncharacterized protein n=1 Tax=Trypanosoma equiperdum TaxID=5694 RepID=A0A1G4HYB2_TRYEQ|nr:hypothetical protein, conserved [Trypanosoma equiperdum]
MDKDVDVTKLTAQALQVHIERCERLMKQPALLSRLPDGGNGIRERYSKYLAEVERRKTNGAASALTAQKDGDDEVRDEDEAQSRPAAVEGCQDEKTVGDTTTAEVTYEEEARAIGERHRHFRVPVEEIVRRTFGGSLCDSELQRIINDVPPGFFLTYEETMSMERKLMEEERAETLERLRRQRSAGGVQ